MSPEAQRIAIAEAVGFPTFGIGHSADSQRYLPNYLHDLNAMHEAEKMLPDLASDDGGADQLGYCEMLAFVVGAKWGSNNSYDMWLLTTATAAQRAEAFLKTIRKWEVSQ